MQLVCGTGKMSDPDKMWHVNSTLCLYLPDRSFSLSLRVAGITAVGYEHLVLLRGKNS